ncbi:hypothetical protein LMG26857_03351 [Achromobacter anxifer]|uniref:hypothetical protein n=1 Tax=Achromobacter anxifer TaxID=1287737 RepID=UPI00155BB989|nr:hypothetical protein [Achromobacter anxifer]CAB5514292.1 hypothetical protein LMG26857_03351 [Achromobacter anxifer]
MVNLYGSLADAAIQADLSKAQEKPHRWTVYLVEANGAKRTDAQNRLYRRLLQKFAQQQGRSVAYWNEYLVERFLGYVDVVTEDGITLHALASTSELSVEEFSGFLNACLVLAAEMQIR